MHKDSCLCVDSSYDYFSVPPTDTTSKGTFFSPLYSLSNVGHGGPLEFHLKSNKTDFIDLSQTFLRLNLKILTAAGAAPAEPPGVGQDNAGVIPADSKVFPVNYLAGALFKDVEVYLGNKLISNSDGHYAYKSFIEVLLGYRRSVLESFGELSGFFRDTGNFNEVTHFDDDHNTGAKARFNRTQYGKSFQLTCKIHNDIFSQIKKFPGDIDLKIRFIRNDENFCLMANNAAERYKIEIDDAVLYVKRLTLDDIFVNEMDTARATSKIMKFPFRRVELKYSTQAPNKAILQENRLISNGELPKRIILGLVDARAWDGSLAHNPFYFQNFGVTEVVLQRGKEVSPFCEMTKLNFPDDMYHDAYTAMVYATGRLFANDPVAITPDEFKSGHTLFCFDLSKSTPNASTFELTESGTVNVIVTLSQPIGAHGIVMVFYNEYDSMLALGSGNQPDVISLASST